MGAKIWCVEHVMLMQKKGLRETGEVEEKSTERSLDRIWGGARRRAAEIGAGARQGSWRGAAELGLDPKLEGEAHIYR